MKMQNSGNQVKEYKSHSSWLFNDRLAVLFYLLDMDAVRMNTEPINSQIMPSLLRRVKALNVQIYKNFRMLLRNDPGLRKAFNVNTAFQHAYTTDLFIDTIIRLINHCEENGDYTVKKVSFLVSELNNFEMEIKAMLQYYNYFVRTGRKIMPDISLASQKYRLMADKMTIEQLKEVVGKNHHVDFSLIQDDVPQLENDAEENDDDEEEDFEDDDTDEE